jgi:HlyD family secretion protein
MIEAETAEEGKTVATNPNVGTRATELGDRVRALRLPHAESGRVRSGWLAWIVCLILAALCGWFGYVVYARPAADGKAQDATAAPGVTSSETPPPGTETPPSPARSPAKGPRGDVALESKGYIMATHTILVSPKVSGMIVRLGNVRLGDAEQAGTPPGRWEPLEGKLCKQGDVIAELEKTDYAADRDRSLAAVAVAKAAVDQAQARVDESEKKFRPQEKEQAEADFAEVTAQLAQQAAEFRRYTDLHQRGNIVADQDLEVSQSKYLALQQRQRRLKNVRDLINEGEREERKRLAKAELAQFKAQLQQAEAELVKALWKLDNCTIRAPITGTIVKKAAEVGNIVNPIAFNGSFSICEMADLTDLEVEVVIQERDIANVFVGQKCEIRADAYRDRVYPGAVARLMPVADRAKAAIPVRVKVAVPATEEGAYLKPEMGANVTFYKPAASNAQ